jgi:Protein-only RNase P
MDKRILVMIRKHVLKWSGAAKLIPEIRKKAQLFAVDNLSRDDLFILYATVRGGRGAQFVSEDLMRNHMFNLKDSRLEVLFRQWLRMSQVRIVKILNNGRVITEPMPRVITIAQSEGKNWHIPFDDGTVRSKFEIPNTWLCLKHLK